MNKHLLTILTVTAFAGMTIVSCKKGSSSTSTKDMITGTWTIARIADDVEQLIKNNGREPWCDFGPETMSKFQEAVRLLRQAHIYAHRIDYLVSGDDGEDSFHERLAGDLNKVEVR